MAGTLVITTLSDGTNSTSATNCIQGSNKAWVNCTGAATPVIRGSYNVSSVTANTSDTFTVNFTNALASTNYAWSFGLQAGSGQGIFAGQDSTDAYKTTTAFRFGTFYQYNGRSANPLSMSLMFIV
jgi:hypothetical protein